MLHQEDMRNVDALVEGNSLGSMDLVPGVDQELENRFHNSSSNRAVPMNDDLPSLQHSAQSRLEEDMRLANSFILGQSLGSIDMVPVEGNASQATKSNQSINDAGSLQSRHLEEQSTASPRSANIVEPDGLRKEY